METIVNVLNITKKFGKRPKFLFWKSSKKTDAEEVIAVNNLSFSVNRGEVFGILGPNGAGKTTLLKCLSTLILPDSGTASILGYDLLKAPEQIRKYIGITFSTDRALYWKLTAYENLRYFSALYNMDKAESKKRINELIDFVGLKNDMHVMVEKFSSGMKQKLSLARALLHNPLIMFLDEPTLGLDPSFSKSIRECIKYNLSREQGKTIILSTHYMEEADFLCDRVAIMNKGKIVAIDTPENLKKSINFNEIIKLRYNYSDKSGSLKTLDGSLLERFQQKLSVKIENNANENVLTITGKNLSLSLNDILQFVYNNGIKVIDLQLSQATLEDVFLYYAGRRLKDGE